MIPRSNGREKGIERAVDTFLHGCFRVARRQAVFFDFLEIYLWCQHHFDGRGGYVIAQFLKGDRVNGGNATEEGLKIAKEHPELNIQVGWSPLGTRYEKNAFNPQNN